MCGLVKLKAGRSWRREEKEYVGRRQLSPHQISPPHPSLSWEIEGRFADLRVRLRLFVPLSLLHVYPVLASPHAPGAQQQQRVKVLQQHALKPVFNKTGPPRHPTRSSYLSSHYTCTKQTRIPLSLLALSVCLSVRS